MPSTPPLHKKPGIGMQSRATSQALTQSQSDIRRYPSRQPSKAMTPIEKERARLEAVSDIITVQDAMDKLIAREYSVPNQEYSNDFLASILIQLTLILPAEGASIVKAVAILLSELELDMRAERAADALMDTLKEPFGQFIEVAAIAKAQAEKIIDGHDSIDNRIANIIGRVDGIHAATIVAKANLALAAMKNNDNFPEGIQFMSAKTLAKGDIVFNMDSPESVEWLRKDGV
ncbi:hypothetical protein PILCRDRAFT_14801 [Piloderma croceum F 1598]|uniref:Uncharacterized protein n=1 Tax=Piloderma croceum (strain F 1598) TaxID=765440 RepID=A0A0C3B9I3_PILCF|nr:hypothetical protein PILCRDRAFT_14801 [Piloderma croceum F 1598]